MSSSFEVVFIPAPGIGHLVSTLEFAKLLLDRTQSLSATVLCLNFPFSGDATAYAKSLAASHPGIKLIDLPPVNPPAVDPRSSVEHASYVAIESAVQNVREALMEIFGGSTNRVAGLVLDFFCMPLLDLAEELGLDSYMFMPSNIAFISLMMYLRDRHVTSEFDVAKINDPIFLPGFKNPVSTGVLPTALFNKKGGYAAYVKLARRFRDVKGIIVNSFSEIEGKSHLGPFPEIYMVGPVLDLKGRAHPSLDEAKRDRIMKWLNEQPKSAVVFLCFGSFGSFGSFNAEQANEIAKGLEASGVRFLWCAKLSRTEDEKRKTLEEILPEGFLERIGDRGMVFEGWAPQVEVLGHAAIGGFVSHCGWNSMLESLWHGVPVVAWPLYAEQRLNAFMMGKELGMVVEMGAEFRAGETEVVKAEQICEAVRRVMDGESAVRERVLKMSSMARKAVANGGSSFADVDLLISDLLRSNN